MARNEKEHLDLQFEDLYRAVSFDKIVSEEEAHAMEGESSTGHMK